jgi:hypothetical protein
VLAFFKKPPFLIWLFASMFFVPRSGLTHAVIMYALFFAWLVGLCVDSLRRWTEIPKSRIVLAATLLSCLFWTAKSVTSIRWYLSPGDRLRDLEVNSRAALSLEDAEAMRWARENTKPDARFFVFNQRIAPWERDLRAEWFPYIAQRQSIYTVQGTEWLPGRAYQAGENRTAALDQIDSEPELVKLIQPAHFDYIFLAGPYDPNRARCAALIRSLPHLRMVYKTANTEIWQRDEFGKTP